MTKIIKKLNKSNISFSIKNNIISFIQNGEPYSIKQINKNKYLLSNRCDDQYISYKQLIKSLNKYQLNKNF